ncbi:MAG: protein translocase subunit SecD [Candidatus Gracilibacteria bacterium]|nr:protein translocase subunit SecD [Candidatus Gracilibacteria bacterium]
MKKDFLLVKLIIILLLSVGAFVYIFPWNYYNVDFIKTNDYKLGLDLQGGIELDYKIMLDEAKKAEDFDAQKEKSVIEGLKSIIDKRVENLKINDSVITSASYGGEQHIIVQIPLKGNNDYENQQNIEKAKETIGKVVKIEFKEKRKEVTDEDKKERKELARTIIAELKSTKDGFTPVAQKYRDNYENVDFGTFTGTKDELKEYFSIDYSNLKDGVFSDIVSGTGKSSMSIENGALKQSQGAAGYYVLAYLGKSVQTISSGEDTSTGVTLSGSTSSETSSGVSSGTGKIAKTQTGVVYSFNYIFLTKAPSDRMPAMDKKGRVLNDKYFVKAGVTYNQLFQPMVELTFNSEGAEIFGELTSRLTGEQIAIFVGGHMLTDPRVNEPILTGKAVITGNYTSDEALELAQNINTGVVPAPIYLTSERTIDSKLGLNSLNKLIVSGVIGFLLIMIFLVYVYRGSGFMASLALLVYVLLLLFIVKAFQTVLTLASIAGLILSIGMAIDANILIFERTKDELRDGKSLKESLNIGFKKSFSAIFDTHLTGLLTALILFIFGINLIKGFGLMLGIGLIISLFTVLYISRVFILFLSKTKISLKNFIGKI